MLTFAIILLASVTPQPSPTPTPNPLTISGFYRAYYFTRQNASNDLGTQFNPSKYNANAVNQATFNNAISLHADYHFAGGGFFVGGTYLYADPFSGPCATA